MSDKVERNTFGVREMLFQQIERLRAGDCDAAEAKAVAALTHQIIETVKLEIEVAKLRSEFPSDAKIELPRPLAMEKKP